MLAHLPPAAALVIPATILNADEWASSLFRGLEEPISATSSATDAVELAIASPCEPRDYRITRA